MAERKLNVSIYTPASAFNRPVRLVAETLFATWQALELSWVLAVRDIHAQYRQAFLGVVWMILIPLANVLVWLFVNATGAVRFEVEGVSYSVFVITGVTLWSVFMDAAVAPLQQTQAAKPMLAKMNFPRESLIVAGMIQSAFNAAIKMSLLLLVLIWLGIPLAAAHLLLPLVIFGLILAGTVLGALLTPLGLVYTDVGRGLPVLLQFLMYLSPVVYSVPDGASAAQWMSLNPMTEVIEFSRMVALGQFPQDLGTYAIIFGIAAGGVIAALVLLRAAWPILIERMSA